MGNANILDNMNQKSCMLGLLSLGFVTVAVTNFVRIQKTDQKVKWMQETKEYSPSECIEEIDKKILERVKEVNKEDQQLAENEIIVKKVLISGRVSCDMPLSSKIDNKTDNLIYRYNFCVSRYSNDNLKNIFNMRRTASQAPKNSTSFYVPEFHLADKNNQEKKLEVWVHLEPKICQSSIDHYSERYTDRELNIYQKFRSRLSSVLNVLALLLQKEKNFSVSRGIEIGFNEYELGIKSGGLLAIIGDVVYNFQTKQLKMINPLTIIGSKKRYIDRLISKKKERQFYFFAFTVISAISIYFLYKEVKKLHRGGRMLVNQQQDSLKNIQKALVKDINDMKCDLCNENNKQIIYKPCGHLVHCKSCSASKNIQVCSACNAQVVESVEIYLS